MVVHSNFVDIKKDWGGCNLRQHQNYDFGCHGHLQGSFQQQHVLQMDLLWMWWWFGASRHSNLHDHTNIRATCLVPT